MRLRYTAVPPLSSPCCSLFFVGRGRAARVAGARGLAAAVLLDPAPTHENKTAEEGQVAADARVGSDVPCVDGHGLHPCQHADGRRYEKQRSSDELHGYSPDPNGKRVITRLFGRNKKNSCSWDIQQEKPTTTSNRKTDRRCHYERPED